MGRTRLGWPRRPKPQSTTCAAPPPRHSTRRAVVWEPRRPSRLSPRRACDASRPVAALRPPPAHPHHTRRDSIGSAPRRGLAQAAPCVRYTALGWHRIAVPPKLRALLISTIPPRRALRHWAGPALRFRPSYALRVKYSIGLAPHRGIAQSTPYIIYKPPALGHPCTRTALTRAATTLRIYDPHIFCALKGIVASG